MRTSSSRIAAAALLLVMLLAGCASGPSARAPSAGDEDFTARVQTLALLQTLNAELLSNDSATFTLERWCAAHRLAEPARVVAERLRDVDKPATPEQRALLKVGPDEPLRYRRVRLRCGEHVLSEADNWYVPARLTASMNEALDTSDVAFGRAVQALKFQRRTLGARLLWSPLPEGWEMSPRPPPQAAPSLEMPRHLLQHSAVLLLPDGTPISNVVETYTSEVLAFRSESAVRH